VHFSWKNLPRALALPLLKGSVGKAHLCAVAQTALNMAGNTADGAFFVRLGAELLCAAWEHDPLDHELSRDLLRVHAVCPCLPRSLEKTAHFFSNASRYPENGDELLAVLGGRDPAAARQYLKRMRRKEPDNLFWTRQALLIGLAEGRHRDVEEWLETCSLPRPVLEACTADLAFARGEYGHAARGYEGAWKSLPVRIWKERLGESLYRLGERDAALAHWEESLRDRPWHANLALRVSDLRQKRDLPGPLPAGSGAVLLYSWNKARCLNAALEALAASELGDALLCVLDNGSSDETPDVLRSWKGRLGERLFPVTLPCNIGAPPARNWLLSLSETRSRDWVAFLDDDALIPPDWLRRFGRAMEAYPDAAAYGCRVTDHASPLSMQSVDLHLDPGGPSGGGDSLEPRFERRFSISGLHYAVRDFGQFSYMRPCVSVTGCCHLFRRAPLDGIGHFDLRYAPTQYDDVEHDIRRALRGELPVYQGHLRVAHMQSSGQAAWEDPVKLLASWANLFKLQTKYRQADFDAIRERDHQSLLADMLGRCEAMSGA
jgi:GT2 family glycosyltransferase